MFEVRLIQPGDIRSFWETLGAVARERKFLAFLDAPSEDQTREYIEGILEQGAPHYVALVGSVVVGWCDIKPATSRAVFSHIGHLGIGIRADFRGKGLGRTLIMKALAHAKEIGLARIELEVYSSNEAAKALYRSVGFEREGIKRKHAFFGDRFEDSEIMALFI